MQIGIRVRAQPSKQLQDTLWQWIGAQEFIYNAKTGEDRYFRAFSRHALALAGQYPPVDQIYSHFNATAIDWIKGTPSQILRNGAVKWFQAYQRFFKKLARRPGFKKRHGKRSVWITSELFRLQGTGEDESPAGDYAIEIGTAKHPIGTIPFYAHVPFRKPNSIHLSMEHGRWHLSFSYEDETVEASDDDTAAWLRQHSEQELQAMTVGFDRGVKAPVVGSGGTRYGFSDVQLQRMAQKEKSKSRWQRRMARRQKGSKRYAKAKARAHAAHRYAVNVRRDFAHQTSHSIAAAPKTHLVVFEALNLRNMTASGKGRVEEPGKNVRQKAGLNRALLSVGLGQIAIYTAYKARRNGKLLLKVPPHYSSQECARCGHVHPDNRVDRDRFVCQRCGHEDDADDNASAVIKARGIRLLLSDAPVTKPVKRCGVTKKKHQKMVGAERSKPAEQRPPTFVETRVRRHRKKSGPATLQSKKREETPTTTRSV